MRLTDRQRRRLAVKGKALGRKLLGLRRGPLGEGSLHSFDHQAANESVIVGDMAHTPLDDKSVDVAVFSLSLMGANFTDYLREAWRILKLDSMLMLWQASSRFDDPKRFGRDLKRLGFRQPEVTDHGKFVEIRALRDDREPEAEFKLQFRAAD